MHTRKIPSTGEALPVVGCGTWQTFDVGPSAAERAPRAEVLKALFEAGGSVIDSSPMYGKSEGVVGDLLAAAGTRDKAFLATKVWTQGRDAGIAQMKESMRLLRTERIDLMQIHNLVDWKTHLPTLKAWKAEGRIRLIGITHYTESMHGELESVLRQGGFDFVQVNYALDDRGIERSLLRFCQDNGVAVLINQPFGGGGLLRKLSRAQAARLGGRDRLHELGADPAEVRARPAGRDLRDPRHRQARAHARQRAGRPRRLSRRQAARPHHQRDRDLEFACRQAVSTCRRRP